MTPFSFMQVGNEYGSIAQLEDNLPNIFEDKELFFFFAGLMHVKYLNSAVGSHGLIACYTSVSKSVEYIKIPHCFGT